MRDFRSMSHSRREDSGHKLRSIELQSQSSFSLCFILIQETLSPPRKEMQDLEGKVSEITRK